jgi:integrase
MAIYWECSTCHNRNSLKKEICSCGQASEARRRYWIGYHSKQGNVLKSIGRVSLSHAKAEEDRLKISIREGRYDQQSDEPTWKEITAAYLRKLETDGANEQYFNDSRRYFKRMGEAWGGDCPVGEINRAGILEFRNDLRDKKLTLATCDRYIAAGKAAWNYSLPDKPNPFKQVKQFNPDNTKHHILSNDDVKRLMSIAQSRLPYLFEMIAVASLTGLRRGNILRLKRSEVDLERNWLSVHQKGNRLHEAPLNEIVVNILRNIPDNGSEYFWLNPNTGKPYTTVKRSWATLKRLAKVNPDIRIHDLRHTMAVNIILTTGSVKAAQQLLGHRSLKTTMRYTHLLDDHLRDAVNGLTLSLPDDVSDE